jgi:hypothetical protein
VCFEATMVLFGTIDGVFEGFMVLFGTIDGVF